MQEVQKAENAVKTDVLVLGAGISGVATAKCLRESGFEVIVLERTRDVGGLWTWKENAYGVMSFTHINVSKHNYCFSDFPFSDTVPDFPHHSHMSQYIRDYVSHFDIEKLIKFNREVKKLQKLENGEWRVSVVLVNEDEKGNITSLNKEEVYIAKYVAIATGHHVKPSMPDFPGLETFKGEAYHSVKFNDAIRNNLVEKTPVIVGIGNSAVDAAVNCATAGRCKPVYLSTRSGAWVVPNYIFGRPADHYPCRVFFWLPWKLGSSILERTIRIINGHPKRWKLNPKMRALQTQPTVSRTLVHHIQREEIKIVPNISHIDGDTVHFEDGSSTKADQIIFCTGYKIDLPYLDQDLQRAVIDEATNTPKLFKNVFSPEIGHSLAFIGFVQPASGGVVTMSETQARWWAELCKGTVKLPDKAAMEEGMRKDQEACSKRYYKSARHTIQRDPIPYCDEIASYFGAKPQFYKHPSLALRLLLSSCGASQYRLQGPHSWEGAREEVKKVPIAELMLYGLLFIFLFILWFISSSFVTLAEINDWCDDCLWDD